MSRVMIMRLSALGDVSLSIPVIYSAACCHPGIEFTLLTRSSFMGLFVACPVNLRVIGIDRGLGIWTFLRFGWCLSGCHDMLIDLHGVIRSRVMGVLFRLRGKGVYVIDKGRVMRGKLVARPPKVISMLPHVTERYADVFRRAGLACEWGFAPLYGGVKRVLPLGIGEKRGMWIGIAPFAGHAIKEYPLCSMEGVVCKLSRLGLRVFLFGSVGRERDVLEGWAVRYSGVTSVAGRYRLDEELIIMSYLDVMLSMDSGNMHLASLVGTRVVSIWGPTHPAAGFYGLGQDLGDAVQLEMDCRPCSIYGERGCYRDHGCMEIEVEEIVERVLWKGVRDEE